MRRFPLPVALAAGLVSATGFAPLDWWPVLLAAFALLLWLVHQAPTLRAAMLRGWVFGVGHFAVGDNWIQHAFDYQDKMPPVLGYFAVLLVALYLAVYPAMAMGLAWKYGRSADGRPRAPYVLIAAAAWIVTEWLRGTMFTGYPWNPLGVVWVPLTATAQLASVIGSYALSGVTVLVAGAVLLAAFRQWRFPLAVATAMIAGTLWGLAVLPVSPQGEYRPGSGPQVLIVQPNIGQDGVSAPDYPERVLARLIALSRAPRANTAPRLVVWPEGMVNFYIEDGYPPRWYWQADPRLIRARIASVLGPRDMALVGGNALFFAPDGKLAGAGNSVWSLDSAGMLGRQRYDKAHLVPYGEYLPFRTLLEPLGLARLVMGDIDFVPGPGPRTIELPGFGKAGMQVCYEIIFSGSTVDPRNRPDFLFNPSNDAWFGSWGPPQHLAQARLRAIEEGLPILRATPTGISAVIDAFGRIRGTVALGKEGVVDQQLPSPRALTLFARLGNWMAFAVAALFVLIAVAFRRFAR